jgi:lipoprotein-anchoring transpeptidase ErfK/SrfK
VKQVPVDRQLYVYNSSMTFHQLPAKSQSSKRQLLLRFIIITIMLIAVIGAVVYGYQHKSAKSMTTGQSTATNTSNHIATTTSKKTAPASTAAQNYCADNTLSQQVLVSISKQHLWACDGTTTAYDSPVVTGMEQYAADLTPPGTYHIYEKETNISLKGCDSTGCWNDPVSYWMPWLSNQYGIYGFHDASWRTPSEFGNVNIYAPETASVVGSHGCVELPTATAKWLYNWSVIGTTVTIES